MLLLLKELVNKPINDLRSGAVIGFTEKPLVDMKNLDILGWWCLPRDQKKPHILLRQDVREFNKFGFFIDDSSSISNPKDLVRLKTVIKNDYDPIGKKVKSEIRKLGKVSDYCINKGLLIQKIYVAPPLPKSLIEDSLIIDRTQILDVTTQYILVRDALIGIKATKTQAVPAVS